VEANKSPHKAPRDARILVKPRHNGFTQEDVARFGYKLNMKEFPKNFLRESFYIFGYLLEPCVEI
jgi:hypothetical protein